MAFATTATASESIVEALFRAFGVVVSGRDLDDTALVALARFFAHKCEAVGQLPLDQIDIPGLVAEAKAHLSEVKARLQKETPCLSEQFPEWC